FESEQFAGRIIEVSDTSIRIGDNDSFLNRIENRFEKSFLLRQAEKIILHLLGSDFAEPPNQFLNEAGFHVQVPSRPLTFPRAGNSTPRARGSSPECPSVFRR